MRRALRQWHPLDPILVSSSSSERMLPPICLPELATALHSQMLMQYRFLLGVIVLFTLASVVCYLNTNALIFGKTAVVGALLFVFVGVQYRFIFTRISLLSDFARFIAWTYLQRRGAVLAFTALMIAAGTVQWLLQKHAGGLEPLLLNYGLVHERALSQWWRYFVGPFFHSGFAHWITNVVMLVVASGLGAPHLTTRGQVILLISGSALPWIILSFIVDHARFADAFLGLSGGILAVLGWVCGIAMRRPERFPIKFGSIVLCFLLLSVAVAELLNPRASTVAHLLGGTWGIVFGWLGVGHRRGDEA